MELEQRVKLARLIVALDEGDKEAVVAAYIDMGIRTKRMGKYERRIDRHKQGEIERERLGLQSHVFVTYRVHAMFMARRCRRGCHLVRPYDMNTNSLFYFENVFDLLPKIEITLKTAVKGAPLSEGSYGREKELKNDISTFDELFDMVKISKPMLCFALALSTGLHCLLNNSRCSIHQCIMLYIVVPCCRRNRQQFGSLRAERAVYRRVRQPELRERGRGHSLGQTSCA